MFAPSVSILLEFHKRVQKKNFPRNVGRIGGSPVDMARIFLFSINYFGLGHYQKSELNSYRRYCDRAADLIGNIEEGAPGAARVLRRGLPIIDQRIKELLEEVKKKSESICKAADLPESELGCRIGQHVATALATDNPLILEREMIIFSMI